MAKPDKWTLLDEWLIESQSALLVADWKVNVVKDASDVDAWADIDPHAQNLTADLRVAHDFWRQEPEKQRLILTHELLHLVTCRTDRVVENLEEALGKVAWAVYEPQYEDATERMTDHLAALIAPLLCLPEFPKA
jgi:hypothetical protein